MRELGVRGLIVYCLNPNCRHQERLDVDGYADNVPVPWFGPRMVCSKCGIIGADARPNWNEQPTRPTVFREDHPEFDGRSNAAELAPQRAKTHWSLFLDYYPGSETHGWTLFPYDAATGW